MTTLDKALRVLEPLMPDQVRTRRRKCDTKRKGMSVKDVAAAGEWSDTRSLLASCVQADVETVLEVQLRAPKLAGDGAGARKVTPGLTPRNPQV